MKRNLLLLSLSLSWGLSHGQNIAGKMREGFDEFIYDWWGGILAVVFVGSFLRNSNYFLGENKDLKAGLTRMFIHILIWVIAITAVRYLMSLSL